MGATSAIGGVLGAANVVGGITKGNSERRAIERQNRIQAEATRASLLTQRQALIDQAAIEKMQVATAQQFAEQQAALGKLDMQSQDAAQRAAIQAQYLQQNMALAEQRFNNEVGLTNSQIQNENAKGQAGKQRFASDQQVLMMQQQGLARQDASARQGISTLQQGQEGLLQLGGAIQQGLAQGAAQGFSSSARDNALNAATRQGIDQFNDVNQQVNIATDNAARQADYTNQISQILKQMGYSEADAMEAAGIAQLSLAQAGYDLNSINLDAALSQLTVDRDTQDMARQAQYDNSLSGMNMDNTARRMALQLGQTATQQQLNTGLKQLEAQARGATYQNPSSPSLLGTALQVGTGAYSVYQQMGGGQQQRATVPQSQYQISNTQLPNMLVSQANYLPQVTPTYAEPEFQSFQRNVRLPSLLAGNR